MCFADLEKAFDIILSKIVEWAMRKKRIQEALARSVMSLYKGVRMKVKVATHLCDEFEVNVGIHNGSVLSPLMFVIVIDVVTNKIGDGTLQQLLYADDLVLIAETMA